MPQVRLVANEHDDDVAIRMVAQFLQPPRDILVRLMLADVIYEQRANSATVVGGCDGAVAFLARRVPDLGLDGLCVDLDAAGRELDANGRLAVQVEFVARESREKVRLADARVANQHH